MVAWRSEWFGLEAPRLYLVCGLPGAGRTTRSRQIADAVAAVPETPSNGWRWIAKRTDNSWTSSRLAGRLVEL
jgi:hypothetical protein